MTAIDLPRNAVIAGRNIRLTWHILSPRAPLYYAEVSPRRLRELEIDSAVTMADVQAELRQYGDYTRYGYATYDKARNRRYLRVYKLAAVLK